MSIGFVWGSSFVCGQVILRFLKKKKGGFTSVPNEHKCTKSICVFAYTDTYVNRVLLHENGIDLTCLGDVLCVK